MKTIQNTKTAEIRRESDERAAELVKTSRGTWIYHPKWIEQMLISWHNGRWPRV